jgi:hypothetical protein
VSEGCVEKISGQEGCCAVDNQPKAGKWFSLFIVSASSLDTLKNEDVASGLYNLCFGTAKI